MSKSSLTNVTILNNHYSSRNGNKIDKITIHHMAGNLSVETCGNVFKNREASSNYGVGSDGRVGCYVEEEYRSWATANPANDRRAINIEVANDGGAPDWHVSDTAIEKTIELCVDICQRNGISRLNYTGTKDGNLTRHNMFMATTCPGAYLQSKFPYIADEVNRRLGQPTPPTPTPIPTGTIGYIQQTLNERYGYNLVVDNIAGYDTWKHLRMAFQHELNVQFNAKLDEDGIWGKETNKVLNKVALKYGCEGNMTWLYQACLNIKGYNTNGIDGKFYKETKNATISYQINQGITDDGVAGKITLTKAFN